ncbi:hypothetical protein Q3G72_028648 [Acer saccharum]|nr:hypothetical protein Q3G72_028648 [Acer saccharum]
MALCDDAFRNEIASLVLKLHIQSCLRDEDMLPCEIEQGLFLGSIGAASYKDGLKSKNVNVTHVLTVAN